jgi:hypothetical protein
MSKLPPLGPADLLVEAGQNWVEGWTIQRVRDYAAKCAQAATAAERERLRAERDALPVSMKLHELTAAIEHLVNVVDAMDWEEVVGLGDVWDHLQAAAKAAHEARAATDTDRAAMARLRRDTGP